MIAELLGRLVAAPTHNPAGDELALARILAGELERRGADRVRVIEAPRAVRASASVLATFGAPRLLVNAHLDTVPPNSGWSGDPFTARVTRERVVGLGACDIKGAIAAVLCALDGTRPRDVAVLFSGDEEAGNLSMRGLLEAKALPPTIDRALVCEPTSLRVGTRHRGILSFEVERAGEGTHSSRADQLPRPIGELARVCVALDDWARARATEGPPGYQGTCLNLASIDGGVAFNVIPSRAVLTASVRPAPGSDVPALREEIAAVVRGAAPEAALRVTLDNAPFSTRDPSRFRDLLGERETVDLGFWTEAALLASAGIDAVVIGPGDIAHAHAPDEWVPIAELEATREMFTHVFEVTRGTR